MTWLELLWEPAQLIRPNNARPRNRGSVHSRNKDGMAFTFFVINRTYQQRHWENCDLVHFGVFVRAGL